MATLAPTCRGASQRIICNLTRATRMPDDLNLSPFSDRALAVTRDTALARIDVLFAHQAERQGARPELEWNIGIAAHFFAVHPECHLIFCAIVVDLEMMRAALRGRVA